MRGVNFHASLKQLLEPIDSVRPHIENPKNGDVDSIIASMRRNGVYRPVYAQRSSGAILAGNHTYAALMELSATQIPVIWLDVDDATARRILAVDNRSADLGRYDDGMLLDLLRTIEEHDGLLGSGYESEDIEALLASIDARGEEPIGVDDFPTYDENLATEFHCPSCGYEWSGPASGISGRGKEKVRS